MASSAIRVLVVAGGGQLAAALAAWLKDSARARFQVEAATSFRDALAALSRLRPQVCLVAQQLDEKDGVAWMQAARQRGCRAPMLLAATQASPELRVRAQRAGAADLLGPDELLPAAVEQALLRARAGAGDGAAGRAGEPAWRENEERFRRLFADLPLGVAMVGPDGRMQLANRALCHMLDYRQEELIGRTLRQLAHPDEDGGEAWLRRLFRGEIPSFQQERRLLSKRGDEIWTRLAAVAVRDWQERIEYAWATLEDVTAAKRWEQDLWQTQKMESLGTLAGGVAHDFNNLLAVITGRSELLRHSLGGGQAPWQHLEAIQRAAARATGLVRQLLAFSRRQVLAPQILNLNSCVAGARETLRDLLGENVTLTTALNPELGSVKADPTQIEQALLNLCVNARDAMPEGGRVAIETGNRDVAAGRGGAPAGRYVFLGFSDSGAGIEPEVRAHIFEPFFTTKGQHQNSGLGLATVYGIMQQSGGWIEVSSEPGAGTHFDLYFPRLDQAAPAPGGGAARGAQAAPR